MKKLIILFFSLFFVNLIFSQERGIKITNQSSKKEIIIKENKRIRIKTIDGKKISGRFRIVENGIILMKNKRIELKNVEKIKRNPLLISTVTSGLFIYAGAATTFFSIAVAQISGDLLIPLFFAIPASGMIYTGIKPPNFLKGYKKDSNWNYELITTSD